MKKKRTRRMQAVSSVLDNGLRVVLCPCDHVVQAHVAIYFGVGSRHESPEENGITHVLEHMLFRGTSAFESSSVLNAAAEDIGGYLDAATYRDHLAFSTGCHSDQLARAIVILADLVQRPRYRDLNTERAIIREELLESLDHKGRLVDLDSILHRQVFGAHGLGQPIEGTLANLDSFRRDRLEAFRRKHLVARNAVLAIAGRLDPKRALGWVERAFGDMASGKAWHNGGPPPAKPKPVMRFVRQTGSQVDMRVAFRGVASSSPLYPAVLLLSRALADGMSSRMHTELIDRQGLAYSLQAGPTTYVDCGLFDFAVAVAPDKAAKTVAAILDFASRARRFRYSDEELKRIRQRYSYELEFMADAPHEMASWFGRASLFGAGSDQREIMRTLKKIDSSELRAVAREIFRPEGLVITAVGELARGQWSGVREVVADWQ